MEIHLDSGEILSLSPEQVVSLQAYIDHPSNAVPVYDPITALVVYQQRWASIDAWIEFHFNQLLTGALGLEPPVAVTTIQNQIDVLNAQKRQLTTPIKT